MHKKVLSLMFICHVLYKYLPISYICLLNLTLTQLGITLYSLAFCTLMFYYLAIFFYCSVCTLKPRPFNSPPQHRCTSQSWYHKISTISSSFNQSQDSRSVQIRCHRLKEVQMVEILSKKHMLVHCRAAGTYFNMVRTVVLWWA